MKELYAAMTGDHASPGNAIAARYRRLDKRRQRMLTRLLEGWSYRMIGEEHQISVGSVQSAVNGAFEAMRKALAGEPRYAHGHPGRGGKKGRARKRQQRKAAGR